MSNSDLQAALSSLELGILRNVSLLVDRQRDVGSDAKDALRGAAVTQEVRRAAAKAHLVPQCDLTDQLLSSRTSM